MRVKEALNLAKSELKDCENGSSVARILLCNFLNFSKEELFLKDNEIFDFSEYFTQIWRFKNGEPLEYITGKASFYSLEFDVFKGVLIPRPETEILVDKVLEVAKDFNMPKIAEIGVGSGIISICLALNLKNALIKSSDISGMAIENATKNAKKFGVSDKVELFNCSYLDKICGQIDILVSNPPYIANEYKLDKWVQNEPKTALFGGVSGDEILKEIIKISSLRDIKILACEMGYDQRESMQKELGNFNYKAEFYKDLAGFDRGFVAFKN
ncbi:HemK/PrmC family methyltransferase [Campylobacter mucosalis]|uniref:HemK/PrmC family methyltransferase n=1 Tax=Campylobacter mucosalis TaxID=202 RepID=UPI00147065C1|nr:HemK/PrmC family methyltransferase [Campylobacter mucosalis]